MTREKAPEHVNTTTDVLAYLQGARGRKNYTVEHLPLDDEGAMQTTIFDGSKPIVQLGHLGNGVKFYANTLSQDHISLDCLEQITAQNKNRIF